MKKAKMGFTLIELLVVIAIIGLLSSVVLATLSSSRMKARDARRRSDLSQIQLALEAYFDANGAYPTSTLGQWMNAEGRCNPLPPSTASAWTLMPNYTGPNAYIPNLAPTYIPSLPGDPAIDPSDSAQRCYGYHSDGTSYYMVAHRGAESTFSAYDPMIRTYPNPTCATPMVQGTFYVASGYGPCF